MVSKKVSDNTIKRTLKMNEKIYKDILKKYESIFKSDKDLEAYLISPERYTITAGIDGLIDEATSNIQTACLTDIRDIRFSQPAQKALFETVIEDRVGALMTKPESLEWKNEIADIIRNNSEKSWKDISKEIQAQTDIGKHNADRIARTEEHIARTNAEYILAKERGANAFYCVCNDPCPICDEQYDGGGDDSITYSMDDVDMLPPVHPNCRCSAIFIKDDSIEDSDDDESTDNIDEEIETDNANEEIETDNANEEIETPMDEDIIEAKQYIEELEEELSGLTDKYEILDLKDEIKMAKEDLKAFELEREDYLKSRSSSVEKIRPEKVEFTNDTNIESKPIEIKEAYGHQENHIPKSVRENINDFAKSTKGKGREYGQYYTESGKISEISEGTTSKVGSSGAVKQWVNTMERHGEKIHFTHNHPGHINGYSLLSPGDIEAFRGHNFQSMSAETGKTRVTLGKLPSWKEGKASDKAISDIYELTLDLERGKNLKRWDTSTKEGFENFANDVNKLAEKGGYYYKIEELDLSNSKKGFPKSNMKDERTQFEKVVDSLEELSVKINNETNIDKKQELQQKYRELSRLI